MPGRKVGGEEEGGESQRGRHPAAGPMHRLPRGSGQQPKERQRQRQPPKAGRDRAGVRHPHKPGPEGQGSIAEQQRRVSEAMGVGGAGHDIRA